MKITGLKRLKITGLLWFMLGANAVIGQQPTSLKADTVPLKYGSHRTGNRTDAAMERWRDYGLGQFIHWGVYAIPGGHWEGKTYDGAAEWIRSWSGNSTPENWKATYDKLYKQFNPVDFDAKKWAKQAKEMGAKYLIFTTKHHDGFCLWPSKYTDYTVKNTPFKRDIVKEVVDAYTAEGIDVYLYFSIIDWNHPGYRSAAPATADDSMAYEDFKKFTRNQLLELLERYPATRGLWFDGTWDPAWIRQAAYADALEQELRTIHPGLIIGSRFRADENGKRHFDSNNKLMGDYEQGWERKLPATYDVIKGRDWDGVMTIPPNQWGYNSDWHSSYVKTADDLSQMLMQAVSLGGNLVVNFGPDGNGNIRPEENAIAQQLGQWVKKMAPAIYSVRYANLPKPDYGYYTRKGQQLYLTVFNRPLNNIVRIAIPRDHIDQPKQVSLNNIILPMKRIDMGLDRDKNSYYDITLPGSFETGTSFILVIDLEKSNGKQSRFGDAKI